MSGFGPPERYTRVVHLALRRIVPSGTPIDYGNAFASSPTSKFGRPFCQRLSIILIGEACSDGLTIAPQNPMRTKWNGVAPICRPDAGKHWQLRGLFHALHKGHFTGAPTTPLRFFALFKNATVSFFLLIDKWLLRTDAAMTVQEIFRVAGGTQWSKTLGGAFPHRAVGIAPQILLKEAGVRSVTDIGIMG